MLNELNTSIDKEYTALRKKVNIESKNMPTLTKFKRILDKSRYGSKIVFRKSL